MPERRDRRPGTRSRAEDRQRTFLAIDHAGGKAGKQKRTAPIRCMNTTGSRLRNLSTLGGTGRKLPAAQPQNPRRSKTATSSYDSAAQIRRRSLFAWERWFREKQFRLVKGAFPRCFLGRG